MRNLKIILSVLFVITIGFFIVRSCVPKKPPTAYREEKAAPVAVKKTVKVPMAPKPAPEGEKPQARMAIILDDWGNNYRLLEPAAGIRRPLTVSILPHLTFSRKIAAEAKRLGLGTMLHMPMQPKSSLAPLEPRTILTSTPDADIRKYIQSALQSVPGVEGVNNHEGSAATSDRRVMRVVLGELQKQGLFFVDSNVISTTVGPQVARETGIFFTKRDVFIDNVMKTDAIRGQLERAKNMALRRGRVVVIGHDKELTIQTIREVAPEFEKQGIVFVYVRDLVAKT